MVVHGRLATRILLVTLLTAGCASSDMASPSPTAVSPTAASSPSSSVISAPSPVAAGTPGRIAASPGSTTVPSPVPYASSRPPPTKLPPIPVGAVPILYYHRVEAPPPAYLSWNRTRKQGFLAYDAIPAAFAAQLDWLAANGYTTILPRDLAAHWDRAAPLPTHPVILTFDDGFHDWVSTVLPLLHAHGMVAEFYVTLDAIARKHITWDEVRALAAAGNGIGGHDVHHIQLAMLGATHPPASAARMWREVSGIRSVIAREVGTAPDSMAYVGGGFNTVLEALVQRAGYTTARSIVRGIVQEKSYRFQMRVVRIGARDDVVDPFTGELVLGLPVFVARMHGVSDRPQR